MQAARQSLVDYGRRLVAGGYVVGADGNLSVRDGDRVLLTPSRLAYDRLEAGQIASIDLNGEGDTSRSSEWAMHCAIYRARPDVKAIVHAHPVFACVLAVRRERLEALLDEVGPVLGGPVSVAEYAPSGSGELGGFAVAGLGPRHAVILANHGTVTVGADLEAAFYRLEVLERAAHVQVLR
jgi:ribulose-5-phosphate 4-epimerase/fuculose-1-phosphate aldolase